MYTQTKNKHVVVVGGGAAGMMAAVFALKAGARVTLLEKNEKLGKKVYITGKGRCNVTNACPLDEMIASFPRNGRFMYAALKFFSPDDLRELLNQNGCPTMVGRGQRVYPESQKASDVTRALSRELTAANIRFHTEVCSLVVEDGVCRGVETVEGGRIAADAVIVATGGLSYPVTGSTGDGLAFAEKTGHRVTAPTPSLVPIVLSDEWARALQGLSLKNVALTLELNGKKAFREQGEMLFTHFGVSGPLVLSASCHLSGSDKKPTLYIDMKPALNAETLMARLNRDIAENPKKHLQSLMTGYLPASMAPLFPAIADVDGGKQAGQISHAERLQIVSTLKKLPLHVSGLRSFSEAVVTRGGVSVRDINPSTMMSKVVDGLYFAGETLDVDGYTGGFNLQIAFSTGALAGDSAARD